MIIQPVIPKDKSLLEESSKTMQNALKEEKVEEDEDDYYASLVAYNFTV